MEGRWSGASLVRSTRASAGAVLSLALLCLLAVGGCVRSTAPVLKEEQVITDSNLLGRWDSTGNEEGYLEITAGDSRDYHATYHGKDGKTGQFRVRLGKVGELTIAEIAPAEPDMSKTSDVYWMLLQPVYSFYWLTQTQPTLEGRTMDGRWFKQYIEAHPDELKIANGDHDNPPLITASTEELQQFILRHYKDEGAFGEIQRFVRPGSTTQPASQPQ